MNCQDTQERIPFYHYGELPAEEEEGLEQHVEECVACRQEANRMSAFARALDARGMTAEAPLLAECRRDLSEALLASSPSPLALRPLRSFFSGRSFFPRPAGPVAGLRRLAFAAALVVLGFVAARVSLRSPARQGPGQTESSIFPTLPNAMTVRSVQPDPISGRVRIGFEANDVKYISGTLDDAKIQRLLLAAAEDQSNAGLRVESVGLLKDYSGSHEVRQALLDALAGDPNPSVRLKAIEGLKSFATRADIRKAFAHALVTDANPGVRVQVIEVLTEHPDDSLVGTFQGLVQSENNNYVRRRCQEALRHMNASEGTF
jgi:hypothetical protein